MDATAIIDARPPRAEPARSSGSPTTHVDVGNGGWGKGRPFRFLRAKNDVAKTGDLIKDATGAKVREFVPERRLDALRPAAGAAGGVSGSWSSRTTCSGPKTVPRR